MARPGAGATARGHDADGAQRRRPATAARLSRGGAPRGGARGASLGTATGQAVEGIEETALRALTKLQQVLPDRLGRRVDALQSHTVRVAGTRRGPEVDGAVLATRA